MKITTVKAFPEKLKMRIPYRTAFVDGWESPIVVCVIHTDECGMGDVYLYISNSLKWSIFSSSKPYFFAGKSYRLIWVVYNLAF